MKASRKQLLRHLVPRRAATVHKGNCGRVAVVAGSRAMVGAGILASMAALRSGAGLVHLFTVADAVPQIAIAYPALIVHGFESKDGALSAHHFEHMKKLLQALEITSVVLGPGLGRTNGTRALIHELVSYLTAKKMRMVLDADALFELDLFALKTAEKDQVVLTPHAGEFLRLFGVQPKTEAEREAAALRAAVECGQVIVLKGNGTVVTNTKGEIVKNQTGNPGLATAGTGDVLAGLIAGLVAQGANPFGAACLAVALHGLAADIALEKQSVHSLIATDLLDYFGSAFKAIEGMS